MDGRRKNRQGQDGAMQVNSQLLRDHTRKVGKPIVAIRAFHDGPEEIQANLGNSDADDFREMPAVLKLCERARVLLTQNLWVQVGLMNGALRHVVGFVWPAGGDPSSEDSSLKSPLCVVVGFDELLLGDEPDASRPGFFSRRSFFPDRPGRARWVPIFRQKVYSASQAFVYCDQFPLVLAWALTHWEAQGMTLRRVRVRIGNRVAAMAGVAFVAVTHPKHPTHLVFEDGLLEWGVFQSAQFPANFRARRRPGLRMRAMFSRTLRKYGFCVPDAWTSDGTAVAAGLLSGLAQVGAEQRRRLSQNGRVPDANAWLWPEGEPAFPDLMHEQAVVYAGGCSIREPRAVAVGRRLLSNLQMPAIREALGCFIPRNPWG